jgi:ubiquinol-cytochrome c reductase core subunit 2
VQNETITGLSDPSTLALDIAHNLAFRRGLGNSLFASPHSPVSAQDVRSYAQKAFAKSNIAVLGSGISSDALSKAVQSSFGGSSSSSSGGSGGLSAGSSTYYGGEQRVPLDLHAGGPNAQPTMVIAFGSTSASTSELKVLQHILGGETSVKWTPGTTPLAHAADKVPGASAKAFLLPYSDAALLGVVVTAPTSEAVAKVAKDVAQIIKGASGAKDDEVKRAIAKAKFADATASERAFGYLTHAGPAVSQHQALGGGG